jgi:hypothetical protein
MQVFFGSAFHPRPTEPIEDAVRSRWSAITWPAECMEESKLGSLKASQENSPSFTEPEGSLPCT